MNGSEIGIIKIIKYLLDPSDTLVSNKSTYNEECRSIPTY